MLWTAEAVEDLKRLALEGKSASHISAALGVGSRNAVIGKASRIGIKLSGGGRASVRGKDAGRARVGPNGRPRIPLGPTPTRNAPALPLARDPGSRRGTSRAAWTSFGEAEIGEMRRLRFEDIRESACRWPLGDPRSGEFAYCGLTPAEGQSYCAGHCRMAYRSPQRARPSRGSEGSARSRVHGGCREAACATRRPAAPSSRTRRSGPERPRPLRAASTRTG